MQFFISHLASWLRTRRFSEPTFSTLWSHKSLEKHSVSLFAHLRLLSSDSFSSLIFFLRLFSSLTLPTSAFSICPYCRKLTSKLPSIICSMPYASSKYAWDEKKLHGSRTVNHCFPVGVGRRTDLRRGSCRIPWPLHPVEFTSNESVIFTYLFSI